MATEEARAMLDALMGGDRNAPLPKGSALPGRGGGNSDSSQLLLPGKRKKSCFDKDIDPLYTAWGVDAYDLFVNTKSDIGVNPNVVDRAAHEEFMQLPAAEQDRLGYNYFLFQKLSELVRQCDRTVSRNKEKLKQELNRKLSQRGGQDFVQDVDEGAVDQLARAMVAIENMTTELNTKLVELDEVAAKEEDRKEQLEPLLEAIRTNVAVEIGVENASSAGEAAANPDSSIVGEVDDEETAAVAEAKPNNTTEQKDEDAIIKQGDSAASSEKAPKPSNPSINEEDRIKLDSLQLELGQLTLQRQRLVFDISRLVALITPQQDAVESQRRHLNYVKSDISTDKTVCIVSGNFMSSRDADERIAAHYAGKQYVGWRLVRDKLESMIKKYGHYGPPPPGRGGSGGGPPPMSPGGGGPSSTGRGGSGGAGGYYGGNGGRDTDRRDGGGYRGGGGGGGRWERMGPPSRGGGGGSYDDRRSSGPPPQGRGGGGWRR